MARLPKSRYLEELARIQEQVNALFEQALVASGFEIPGATDPPGSWTPTADLVETADGFLVYLELPGIRREEIDLELRDGRLEVSGRRHPQEEGRNFHRMERSYGPFRRSFELPATIDAGGIAAEFKDGLLTVQVPKVGAEERPGKRAGRG
jgi:HSP20 family protein